MTLSKKFIEEMKEELLKEEKRLREELSNFAKPNEHNNLDFETEFPNYGDTMEDNTSEVETYDSNLAIEHTLEKELRDVVNALKRIEDGTYGICKYCHQEISEDRLRARPTSSSCIACKTKLKGE